MRNPLDHTADLRGVVLNDLIVKMANTEGLDGGLLRLAATDATPPLGYP